MEGQNNGGNRERNVVVPSQDPLKNPVILDNILRRIRFEDMKNVRCVSKMWRDTRILPWRNHLAVFNVNKTTERALKLSLNVNSKSKNKLYLVQEKPFKQYNLTSASANGFHYFPPALPAAEESLYFWNNCGPILTYLNIGNRSIFENNMHFEGLKWILNCCPNLEKLKFIPCKRSMEFEPGTNPANVVTAAAAETVVARKLKFLSISSVERDHINQRWYPELFSDDTLLARRFFNLIPNLQELDLDLKDSVVDVVEGLRRLTLGPMSLEKIFLRGPWVFGVERDVCLLSYIRELGTAQKIKALGLTVDLNSIWGHPSRLKNILKSIRPRVEEFELKVVPFHQCYAPRESIRSLDLFRFNFTHLKSLTLKFKYLDLCGSLNRPGAKRLRYLAFDFSVLRGTPNLEYFFYGCRPFKPVQWLTSPLTVADLEGNGRYPNWRLDENEIERVDAEEAANNIEVEGGDENVFAPEEGEIVLEKMKEFHFEGCFNIGALHALGRMMPHLKTLETILDSETLPVVFQVWGGNGDTLKNVKVLLLRRSQEMPKFITKKKEEFPQINIVKAAGEENW